MNILPILIAFVLVFACASYAMLREKVSMDKKVWGYTGFMQVERQLRNKMHRSSYNNAKSQSPKKKNPSLPKKTPTTDPKTYENSRRFKNPPPSLGRLAIRPLFETATTVSKTLLYETTARLLQQLYGHMEWYKTSPDLEYCLLDALIKKAQELKEVKALSELFPTEAPLSQIYYKMLKGTPHYDLTKKQGYPPLEDFFCVDKEASNAPIHFCFAPYLLLEALFGHPLAEAIREEEKILSQKESAFRYLDRPALEEVLSKAPPPSIDRAALYELLNFGKNPEPATRVRAIDAQSKVILNRKP